MQSDYSGHLEQPWVRVLSTYFVRAWIAGRHPLDFRLETPNVAAYVAVFNNPYQVRTRKWLIFWSAPDHF
jgi:hypothetical protein